MRLDEVVERTEFINKEKIMMKKTIEITLLVLAGSVSMVGGAVA